MKARSTSSWLLIAATILFFLSTAVLGLAEVKTRSGDNGSVNNPTPLSIYSFCPPAECFGGWSGTDTPAGGNTNFTPIKIPIQFTFQTGEPLTYSCNEEYEICQATYGSGGFFTMTGPAGTFTGIVTSGSAVEGPTSSQIFVNFSGQWSNGQRMTGNASEVDEDQNQAPDTALNMYPAP
jgi:hypothetical protein